MTSNERAQMIESISRMLKDMPDEHVSCAYHFTLGLSGGRREGMRRDTAHQFVTAAFKVIEYGTAI